MKNGVVRLMVERKRLTEKDVSMIVNIDSDSFVTVSYCEIDSIDISTMNPFVRFECCDFINSRIVTKPNTVYSCVFRGAERKGPSRVAITTLGYYTPIVI